jgi:hypothetical protein
MFMLIACACIGILDLKNGIKNSNFPKKANLEVPRSMGTLHISIRENIWICW